METQGRPCDFLVFPQALIKPRAHPGYMTNIDSDGINVGGGEKELPKAASLGKAPS